MYYLKQKLVLLLDSLLALLLTGLLRAYRVVVLVLRCVIRMIPAASSSNSQTSPLDGANRTILVSAAPATNVLEGVYEGCHVLSFMRRHPPLGVAHVLNQVVLR